MDNQLEPKPAQAVNDEPELVLDEDDLTQIAKFLDALLEVDMTNKSNERNKHNENNNLPNNRESNLQFEPMVQ